MRRSGNWSTGQVPRHVISVWASTQQMVDGGGNDVLTLKANQDELFDLVQDFTIMEGPEHQAKLTEKAHGQMGTPRRT